MASDKDQNGQDKRPEEEVQEYKKMKVLTMQEALEIKRRRAQKAQTR